MHSKIWGPGWKNIFMKAWHPFFWHKQVSVRKKAGGPLICNEHDSLIKNYMLRNTPCWASKVDLIPFPLIFCHKWLCGVWHVAWNPCTFLKLRNVTFSGLIKCDIQLEPLNWWICPIVLHRRTCIELSVWPNSDLWFVTVHFQPL